MPFNGLSPAPELVRAPFGLETVATVITHGEDDEHWGNGFSQESLLCHYSASTWAMCQVPADGATDYEAYTQLFGDGVPGSADVWTPIRPWFIQAEDTCTDARVLRRPEARDRVAEVLESITFKGIERELWYGAHTTADPDWQNPSFENGDAPFPVNVTTGQVAPVTALAAIEDGLAEALPGTRGVIHMTPGMAVLLSGQLEVDLANEPTIMRTKVTGTPVVVGTGYAQGGGGFVNTIFGTGPIVVHIGSKRFITPDLAAGAVVAENKFKIVAERPVAAAFDPCVLVRGTTTVPS